MKTKLPWILAVGAVIGLCLYPWNCHLFFDEVREIRQTIRLKSNLFVVIEGIGSGATTPDSRVIHLSNNPKEVSDETRLATLTGIDPKALFSASLVKNTVRVHCPTSKYYTGYRKTIEIDGIKYFLDIRHKEFSTD